MTVWWTSLAFNVLTLTSACLGLNPTHDNMLDVQMNSPEVILSIGRDVMHQLWPGLRLLLVA